MLGLLNLARRTSGERVMIEELSREEKIPRNFLAKIFQSLARAGLVQSIRGSGGGFSLARKPSEITVLEVIEAIEGRIALQRCLKEVPTCDHMGGCALCGIFEEAQDRVKEVFTQTTLADLLVAKPGRRVQPQTEFAGKRRRNTLKVGTV